MKGKIGWMVLAVVAALLALSVAGVSAQGTTVTIGLSEFKFDPNKLDVTQGTEVTFNVTNNGQFPHNVTFVAPDGTESKLFEANLATGESKTGTFTFNQAGEWQMYCPVGNHKGQGMVGTVQVAAAAAATPAATTAAATPEATATASAAATTATQPATLPTTGGGLDLVAGAVIAGLGAIGAGLRMRRR